MFLKKSKTSQTALIFISGINGRFEPINISDPSTRRANQNSFPAAVSIFLIKMFLYIRLAKINLQAFVIIRIAVVWYSTLLQINWTEII